MNGVPEEIEEKTVAEKMVEDLSAIRTSLERILRTGITKDMLITLVSQDAKISKTNTRAVVESLFNVMETLNRPYKEEGKR